MGFYEDKVKITLSTLIERYIDKEEINAEESILKNDEKVDLIPSDLNLAMTEANLTNARDREKAMQCCLEKLKEQYDYIIIDCMPSLSMIINNVLATADEVIIPVQPQFLSAVGMGNLLNTILNIKNSMNKDIKVGGFLLTLVDNRTKLPNQIKQKLQENYGNIVKMYDVQIPFAIKTAESTSRGKSIFAYDKRSKVAEAYSIFAKEVLEDDKRERRKNALAKSRCL